MKRDPWPQRRDRGWPEVKAESLAKPAAIEIEVVCRTCGEEFTPAPGSYVKADWRLCPSCRTHPVEDQAA